jgi:amino acid adenylation domain-containing protein
LVIVDHKSLSRFPNLATKFLRLEGMDSLGDVTPTPSFGWRSSDQLVYAISTSGSTGVPKWVGVTHRNLLTYVDAILQTLGLHDAPEDTQLHFASVSSVATDLGNSCIFPALLSGGCLHLIPYDVFVDATRFAEYQTEHRIDVLKIVPSHWAGLFSESQATPTKFPARWLILGGENVPPRALAMARNCKTSCALLNHYGPTETTIGCLTAQIDLEQDGRPPIGLPLPNTSAYLIDSSGDFTPLGMPGQLYIGGDGVSRGYINDSVQTAQRFLPDPFSGVPGGRLYRTGDLARRRIDGNIEFLGRTDRQVKINGHRVELREIEEALHAIPDIRESAVTAATTDGGVVRILAYIVPDHNSAIRPNDIYRALQSALPAYMVPNRIILLGALPLNRTGKVDLAALPDADDSDSCTLDSMTLTEEVVAGAMANVLGLPSVRLQDNFFHLGGDSLLGTKVVARICEALGTTISLRDLFMFPSPATLAAAVDRNEQSKDRESLLPSRAPRVPSMPLSFAQERVWFFEQLEPGTPSYIVPALVRIQGILDITRLETSVNAVIERHEILRTTFHSDEGRPYQRILPQLSVQIDVVDRDSRQGGEAEEEVYQLARAEARRPFDLSHAPLMRLTLFKLGSEDWVLLLTIHHIICDGWSIGIFVQEVTEHYRTSYRGNPPHLSPLSLQYVDFAVWQRKWLQGTILEEQLEHWRLKLHGAQSLAFPTDYDRPPHLTFDGASLAFEFDPKLSSSIMEFSRRENATVFMTLMAGLQALLCRYAGQEEFVIGAGISNRPRREWEGVIGFFVNSIAIRASLSGNPSFLQLVQRVRTETLDAYTHQDLPFDKLVAGSQFRRRSDRNPIFQVLFHMQNFLRAAVEIPGAVLTPVWMDFGSVNFDFTLSMAQHSGVLRGTLDYNINLFRRETMEGFLAHFEKLMQKAVEAADLPVLSLSLGESIAGRLGDPGRFATEHFSFASGVPADRK